MRRTYEVGGGTLELHLGDITRLQVDAIVNSENSDLLMDRGPQSVSGAIRSIEGEGMAADLAKLGPLEPGRAVVLPATRLPCRWVIHAASVVRTEAGHRSSPEVIERAVRSSLQLAAGLGLGSIAFPAFGVRAAEVPPAEASRAMVRALVDGLRAPSSLKRIVVALLDPESFLAFYEEALREATRASEPLVLRLGWQDEQLTWSLPHDGALEQLASVPLAAGQRAELAGQLARLRAQEGRRLLDLPGELAALGERVEGLMPGAVRERLSHEGDRPLVLSLEDALGAVPFELARAGGEAPLALNRQVARMHRSRQGRRGEGGAERAGPLRCLVLPGGNPGLAGAQREGQAVVDLLWRRAGERARTTLLAGARATRPRVLDALTHADLVHWCGHTAAGEGGPAWSLGAGALTPADVEGLGRAPALVVANSCGCEDALAFARAFLLAGARHFVGSWWELEDGVARTLAAELYESLALGRCLGEALLAARRALAADPLHWAAYFHYGDPRWRLVEPQPLP